MKLRTRLALATFAMTIPIIVLVLWLDARARHQAARESLVHVAQLFMRSERARCEADPAHWGGHPLPPPADERGPGGPPPEDPRPPGDENRGPSPVSPPSRPPRDEPDMPSYRAGGPPPILYAYDTALRSENPNAPTLSGPPSTPLWPSADVRVLVAMPWQTGPCARILAIGGTNPNWVGGLVPTSPVWLIAIGAVWLALALSFGSVVRRIRALTRAVGRSASNGYTGAVPAHGTDEISELAHAFDAAGREVRKQLAVTERREKALREYVANTTHDVMIPLTVLRSHLAELEEHAKAGGSVDSALLAQAMTEADYLGALTANLGVASKLDAGEPAVVRTTFDLRALVERVLARHKTIARQRKVLFDGAIPDGPIEVNGDVTLIEQAVNNLVHNAIRYNREGGHVALVLDRRGDDGYVITVADDGAGVPEDELGKLAERGYRGNAARTREKGQGLGLSIVARVAVLMNMQFALVNRDGGGLEATLMGKLASAA
jgi:signal transduction histidine kinase